MVTLILHTNNPVIKHKADLLNLAEEFGNVSRAFKVMGVSRDTFYQYHELVADGVDALINRSKPAPNVKNRVDKETQAAVIEHATNLPVRFIPLFKMTPYFSRLKYSLNL